MSAPSIVRPRFLSRLPSWKEIQAHSGLPHLRKAMVVCDRKLKRQPFLKPWRGRKEFVFYFVEGGEAAKSLERLPDRFKKILELIARSGPSAGNDQLSFISLGGGSIGDLTGFIASVYRRGAPLIHVPATYLAALDSAHGGKNALNISGIKNVAGTCHFPQAVFVVEEIFQTLPPQEKQAAFGELLKIALIEGGDLYQSLEKLCPPPPLQKNPSSRTAPVQGKSCSALSEREALRSHSTQSAASWSGAARLLEEPLRMNFIQQAVEAKLKIVRKDPFETLSLRRTLNLGHTLGHILEAACALPHGEAVYEGLRFSLCWSARKKILPRGRFEDIQSRFFPSLHWKEGAAPKGSPLRRAQRPLSRPLFQKLLRRDKKYISPSCLEFVFLSRPGSAVIRKVREEELIREAERQGICSTD